VKKIVKYSLKKSKYWEFYTFSHLKRETVYIKDNNIWENEHFLIWLAIALGGKGDDEQDKYRDKIMRNVLKEVVLDKKSVVLK